MGGRGIGVGSVVIALVAWGVFGINPLTTLGLLAGSGQTQVAHQAPARQPPANDRDAAFVSTVLASTEDLANFQAQTNLGILSGSAQWQGDLVFDPCQPGNKITIRGNDTIHRSLSGYRIDSKIYIVSNSPELHTYFPEGFLLNARRHIGWSGNVQTSFNLPGRTVQKDGNTLTWQDINGQVSLNKENNELIPTELQFSIPAIELKSGQTSLSLQNLSHRSQNSFLTRSEERRVGKECRSRWSPYH